MACAPCAQPSITGVHFRALCVSCTRAHARWHSGLPRKGRVCSQWSCVCVCVCVCVKSSVLKGTEAGDSAAELFPTANWSVAEQQQAGLTCGEELPTRGVDGARPFLGLHCGTITTGLERHRLSVEQSVRAVPVVVYTLSRCDRRQISGRAQALFGWKQQPKMSKVGGGETPVDYWVGSLKF